jgi:Flp pilus assembly protein TadD
VGLVCIALLGGCASTGDTAGPDMVAYDRLIAKAEQSAASGNRPEAIMNYMNAQEILPKAEVWHRIGLLQLEQGNEFPAMSAFQTAIAEDRDYAPSLEAIGLLYLQWKQSKHAEIVLTKAVKNDASLWRSHNGLGIIADLNGDSQSAQKQYAKALGLKPGSADILNNIGYSHFLSGDNQRAEQVLDSAVKKNREHRIAWDNMARVLARQKRYGDAYNILVGQYGKAIAYHDVGYIALLNGDYIFADDYLSKAIHASPQYFEEAFNNREAARNRMIGNYEGKIVTRSETNYPFCIGLGGESC